MGNQCLGICKQGRNRNQPTKHEQMLTGEDSEAANITSAAWSSKNQSVVDAQRQKIEAMMSNCSGNESNHLMDDGDRKCWWLEDDKCEDSKQNPLNDRTSRTTQKIVSFSCVDQL